MRKFIMALLALATMAIGLPAAADRYHGDRRAYAYGHGRHYHRAYGHYRHFDRRHRFYRHHYPHYAHRHYR